MQKLIINKKIKIYETVQVVNYCYCTENNLSRFNILSATLDTDDRSTSKNGATTSQQLIVVAVLAPPHHQDFFMIFILKMMEISIVSSIQGSFFFQHTIFCNHQHRGPPVKRQVLGGILDQHMMLAAVKSCCLHSCCLTAAHVIGDHSII